MDELRRRFASLDRVAVPDQWAEIERRADALSQGAASTLAGRLRLRPGALGAPLPAQAWRPALAWVLILALLAAVLATSVAVGSWPWSGRRSALAPATPTAPALSAPGAGPLIAYLRSGTYHPATCSPQVPCADWHSTSALWTINADGSGARDLFPDRTDVSISSVAWSPDGTRLLFVEGGKLFLTDPSGSRVEPIDTGCQAPCVADGNAQFSASGTSIFFIRSLASGPFAVEAMDLASGHVTQVALTADWGDFQRWQAGRWQLSPDGLQIVFDHASKFNEGNAVFVVGLDGKNPRQLTPAKLYGRSPSWSPDGSTIVFTSYFNEIVGTLGKDAVAVLHRDIYTMRADGTDLRRLTTDGVSRGATWTPDGRILFVRVPLESGNMSTADPAAGFWTMAADGSDARQIPGTSSAITPDTYYDEALAFWEPTP